MYVSGKVTSEFPSLVPAVVQPCCQRQGCSLIEWKALGLPCASSPTWKAESAKHIPTPSQLLRLSTTAQEVPPLPAQPTETAGPHLCPGVTAKEEKQLGCIEEAGINRSWKGGKTKAPLKNPTCRHC